jgi:diguanylate cyclase (GGDEF)-like protein/putative nucleotidyltransferase with HDIG domain
MQSAGTRFPGKIKPYRLLERWLNFSESIFKFFFGQIIVSDLSWKARIFIISIIAVGLGLSVFNLVNIDWQNYWLLILTAVAAVAQVYKVEGATRKSSYNLSWVVYGLAFVFLGGPAALFIILVAHLIDWAWHKYPWYIQVFNMAAFAIVVSVTTWIYNWILTAQLSSSILTTLAILAAMSVFTLLNHLLIGLVIWFARGQNFSQSGIFGLNTVMIDFTLLGLGVVAALIWSINPSAVLLVLIPLYLIYLTLQVPNLQRQTEIDPKTNLYNARHFADALEKEYDRALRYDRPLTVAIGDLDLLRNINNTYGHLAGDVVLIKVAEILQNQFRDYDLVARFGGEEFAILMPETTPEQAFPRVEAVRQLIAATDFEVSTSVTPIKASISFGIASRDGQGSAEDIIHDADVTLYRSKLMGRNVTCVYSSENIDQLFENIDPEESDHQGAPLETRLSASQFPSQPNPLREQPHQKELPANPVSPSPQEDKTPFAWRVNSFIALLATVALGLAILGLPHSPLPDWFGLLAFALIVLVTEGLSLDIYINDTSISTAAAPLIAGTLLFGPIGVIVLSLVLAGTAMIKHRSQLNRFIFNSANHFLSTFLGAYLVLFLSVPFISLSGYLQIFFTILGGNIVFICSTLLLSGVMSLSTGQSLQDVWTERFRWLWPYYLAFGIVAYALVLGYSFAGVLGLMAVLVPLLMLRFSHMQYINKTRIMVSQLREQNSELEENSNRITALNEEILFSLAKVIDMRDSYTMGHSNAVSEYATQIAEQLGLSSEKIDLIRTGALLHDIGKIGTPDSILFKPGPLTDEEFEFIKQHPVRGAELVRTNNCLREMIPLIRHHHERYDGHGYPDGLQGQEIPLEARILCVADSVQAMESDRPYRKALSKQEIISEIKENAGTQFDPLITKAFLRVLEKEGSVPIKPLTKELANIKPLFFNVEKDRKRDFVPVDMQEQKSSI